MLRFLVLLLLFSTPVYAVEFTSSNQMATVVELYTSEGCSNCPPAEAWFSSFRQDPRLFHSIVPLAFHVDYWDQLGWKDRFAKHLYTVRQQNQVQAGILSQVYTPGIVVNNQEWRQWFQGRRDLPRSGVNVGVLSVSLANGELTASYPSNKVLALHIAYLGMGLRSKVKAGENKDRTLYHDFVVLKTWQQTGQANWNTSLPEIPQAGQQRNAIAVWLTPIDSFNVIQATGHFLGK